MLQLTINPIVQAALQAAFPKPTNSASNALAKYQAVLQQMLFDAMQRGQTPEERKLKLYSISTEQLAQRGSQIGKDKIRLHKWLSDNDMELVKIVTVGNNLSGKSSQVKLTRLVTMKDTLANGINELTENLSSREIDAYLDGTAEGNAELFRLAHSDFDNTMTDAELALQYDSVQLDIESLKNYIEWLQYVATKFTAVKKAELLRQARLVLGLALARNGTLLQRIKPSSFGRTYYHGISVQNVSRELRAAMLGDCWEYDIRSSVVAWKMGVAKECHAAECSNVEFRRSFSASLSYLEDKADFMSTVQRHVFAETTNTPKELQLKLIKQAFTALGFGARTNSYGWRDSTGTWINPAIVEIIKNGEERKRFLNNFVVKAFIAEQNRLDSYLYNTVKTHAPLLLEKSELRSAGGRESKSKVLAYLYQHSETQVMDIVRKTLQEFKFTVLASIHDAIIVRKKLSIDIRDEIQHRMREATSNPYWHLTPKELIGYEPRLLDVKTEEARHRQSIANEEAVAVSYVPKNSEILVSHKI